jgi:hypothetical protein
MAKETSDDAVFFTDRQKDCFFAEKVRHESTRLN